MNSTVRVLLWVGICVAAAASTVLSASAVTVRDDSLLGEPQLYISGYERTDDGLGLQFMQLYNNDDRPLDVQQWGFYLDEVKPERKLSFNTSLAGGFLEPRAHVIVSSGQAVVGATYSFGVNQPKFAAADKATIIIVPPSGSGLKNAAYELKATKTVYYEIWLRNQTTTGYSSTATSFTAVAATTAGAHYGESYSLYDNGLYYIPTAPGVHIVEVYPYSSDCDPFDASVLCSDYVKLQIDDPQIDLSQYRLRSDSNSASSTTSNTFMLSDAALSADGFATIHLTSDGGRVSLTNSGGYVWIEDLYGLTVYPQTMTQYVSASSDHQGWSWAQTSDGTWQWTMTPQPHTANLLTLPAVLAAEVKVCPAGQYRNPETNRCRAIEEAVNALTACPEGQYRNPDTNRCRVITVATSASLVPCGEGQERNPETNRCRSIASAVAELIPCDEGYERNPATNRCRKLSSTAAPSAVSQPADVVAATASPFANPYMIAAVVGAGSIGYALYEWRTEIGGSYKRFASRLGKK